MEPIINRIHQFKSNPSARTEVGEVAYSLIDGRYDASYGTK